MGVQTKNILLVDDETDVREAIESLISESNIIIHQANGCEQAREILSSYEIDLVLCDISMPAESGINLVPDCKDGLKNIKIVFISDYANFLAGNPLVKRADGVINKPFTKDQILTFIRKILN